MLLSDGALSPAGAATVITSGEPLGAVIIVSFRVTRQGDILLLIQGTIKRAPRSPRQDSAQGPAHGGGGGAVGRGGGHQASFVMLTRLFTLGFSHQPRFSGSPRGLLPRSFSRLQVRAAPSGHLRASPLPPPKSTSSTLPVTRDEENSYLGLSFPVCKKEVERAPSLKELRVSYYVWINYSTGLGRTLL